MTIIHRTEVDGIQAMWSLVRHRITIVSVHRLPDGAVLASFASDRCPDLAEARERLPELTRLWDAVRHDLWEQLIPRSRSSCYIGPSGREVECEPAESDWAQEPESVRGWLQAVESKAGDGYRLERKPDPLYGWNLLDVSGGVACSGSLERIELWILRRNVRSGGGSPGVG
ncbi:hypothetical protein CRH09_26050 [Nocardia terpenica]|uniref:Uncharacterized protein n=1 Tax=Nocardia terpenica TaxID=455432 RepID=A0A291RP65_9NOCA|nr:hypothetical protein CRH09_26050 [Nocardia terpenica]